MACHPVTVVGGGVAGCAAALAAARHGAQVRLIEQRPAWATAVHTTALLCELVGSPDLGATAHDRAAGLLKAEVALLSPAVLECADAARIGRESLTLDRAQFACAVTERIEADDCVLLLREHLVALPEGVVVLASGPATWSPLARAVHRAAAVGFRFSFRGRGPLVAAEGIDLSDAVRAPQYPGADPVLFLPISEQEATELARRFASGERAEPPEWSEQTVLADESEPAERLAADAETFARRLLCGPRGSDVPLAAPALRLLADDREERAWHLPDLVTALTPQAQAQALGAVRALAQTRLVRPGLVHRLPWLPGDSALLPTLQLRHAPRVLVAGTLSGAAGYVEALATGTIAGIGAAALARGLQPTVVPAESLTGALCRALVSELFTDGRMVRANFGMLPERAENEGRPKPERRARQIERALEAVRGLVAQWS